MEPIILGGSWVVISMVICPLIWVLAIVTLYIAPHRTTHEPPSKACKYQPKGPEEAEDPEDSVDVALAVASFFRTVGLREVQVLGFGLYSCVF